MSSNSQYMPNVPIPSSEFENFQNKSQANNQQQIDAMIQTLKKEHLRKQEVELSQSQSQSYSQSMSRSQSNSRINSGISIEDENDNDIYDDNDEDEIKENNKHAKDGTSFHDSNSVPIDIDPIEIDSDDEENIREYIKEKGLSNSRQRWINLSWLATFYIPDCCTRKKDPESIQAWREKATIFTMYFLCNVFIIFIIAFFPKLVCPDVAVYTWKDIWAQRNAVWMVTNGVILDVTSYANIHPGPINKFMEYAGQDISSMFNLPDPVMKPALSDFVIYPDRLTLFNAYKKNDTQKYCSLNYCHPYTSLTNTTKNIVGNLAVSWDQLYSNPNSKWFILYNRVYNISDYYEYGHPVYPPPFDFVTKRKEIAYYLDTRLNDTMLNRIGQDATALFEKTFTQFERQPIIDFLDQVYYSGMVDTRFNFACVVLDYTYISIVGIMACILGIIFLLSLCILYPAHPKCKEKYLIACVPCYTEGPESTNKTFNSLFDSEYTDKKKLIFAIVDGILTGEGNFETTAASVLRYFGRSMDENVTTFSYISTSIDEKKRENLASVYVGHHTNNNHTVPYVVIVKHGLPSEQKDPKPGNRGKRDSQLILLCFLRFIHNKYFETQTSYTHHVNSSQNKTKSNGYVVLNEKNTNNDNPQLETGMGPAYDAVKDKVYCALNNEIFEQMIKNKISPEKYKYIEQVDADTDLDSKALLHKVFKMKDPNTIAICGETRISNKAQTWVTCIQVYMYYITHHLIKNFESLFGSVTCLPGCFSMLRIRGETRRNKPIVIDYNILAEYSKADVDTLHEKNLLDLGEDRFFTTLLTKYFPTYCIKFTPNAICHTVVPHTWEMLKSQQRRWMNSTVHNMFELMFVNRMCGFLCFSNKFLVIMNFITLMVLPGSYLYLMYLIIAFVMGWETVSTVFIITISAVIGIQVAVFLIRRDFKTIIWFAIYINPIVLGIWTFYLPTYSFSNMDKFDWGKTRMIKSAETTEDKNKILLQHMVSSSALLKSTGSAATSACSSTVSSPVLGTRSLV